MTVFITIVDMEDTTVVLNIDKIHTICLIEKAFEDHPDDAFNCHGKHVKICCDENNWVRTRVSLEGIERAIYHAQWDHERNVGVWRATGAQVIS